MRAEIAAAAAAILLLGHPGAIAAQEPTAHEQVGPGVEELRYIIGSWRVRTEFTNPDGTTARAVDGSYQFDWAIPDAIVRGIARQPELGGATAILLYVRPAAEEIEMVAVDQAGIRWVMTGREGSDIRTTLDRDMSDGSRMRLRFTRYNVEPCRFESRMEYSTDGGRNWVQGNRQIFERQAYSPDSRQTVPAEHKVCS